MKKIESIQKEVHQSIKSESLSGITGNNSAHKAVRRLRNLFYLACLAGIGLFFNSCIAGYVTTEPSYVVVSRPPQPSNVHFWIDGDWRWSIQSQGYVRNKGYWGKPRENQTYIVGYWQSSPRGKYWQNGHWQKQNNQGYKKENNHR